MTRLYTAVPAAQWLTHILSTLAAHVDVQNSGATAQTLRWHAMSGLIDGLKDKIQAFIGRTPDSPSRQVCIWALFVPLPAPAKICHEWQLTAVDKRCRPAYYAHADRIPPPLTPHRPDLSDAGRNTQS